MAKHVLLHHFFFKADEKHYIYIRTNKKYYIYIQQQGQFERHVIIPKVQFIISHFQNMKAEQWYIYPPSSVCLSAKYLINIVQKVIAGLTSTIFESQAGTAVCTNTTAASPSP